MDLKGKTVLVTGGAVRIGRAICLSFAEAGAKVIIHYNRSGREAALLLDEIGGADAGHDTLKCDLTSANAAETLMSSCGRVEILVNNASIYVPCVIAAETPEAAKAQFEINFWAPLALMRRFYGQKTGSGCVINILDRNISRTSPGDGSYIFSKKLLAEATLSAALQWAPRMCVNGVAPGAVLPPRGMENSRMKAQLAKTPMKKSPLPSQVAEACVFLARNDSITGQIIFVDGGQHL